jgi:hypothetical protein
VTALVVVCDANVLYAAPVRDVLMHLALAPLVEARWTHLIQAQWLRNVLQNRVDLERSKLERTQELMNAAVPNALVIGFEHLIETLQPPDGDDRHVLAAAIQTRATIINNQKPVRFSSRMTVDGFLRILEKQDLHGTVRRLKPFAVSL